MIESEYFEKLSIPFNISKLRTEFLTNTKALPPIMIGSHFGGWSISSSTGEYTDGWVIHPIVGASTEKSIQDVRKNNSVIGFKGPQFYRQPTSLCIGEAKQIIDYLDSQGFFPCRARFTILKGQSSTEFHRDYPEWLYGVRLHIPVITNPDCFFEYENEKKHLLSDGSSYLLKVNKTHRVVNSGATDRIHFLCDFFDTRQKTKYNKFTQEDFKRAGIRSHIF